MEVHANTRGITVTPLKWTARRSPHEKARDDAERARDGTMEVQKRRAHEDEKEEEEEEEERIRPMEEPKHDPYHHCADGGWHACCEANARRRDDRYFEGRPGRKYGHRWAFSYRRWVWFDELFFEELVDPARLPPTACGLCAFCAANPRQTRRCTTPQPRGTYAKWHSARTREWIESSAADQKEDANTRA